MLYTYYEYREVLEPLYFLYLELLGYDRVSILMLGGLMFNLPFIARISEGAAFGSSSFAATSS